MNIQQKIEEYSIKVEKFIETEGKDENGKDINFKIIGASSGVYRHRDPKKFMVRPRTTGGVFDSYIFEKLYEIRKKYRGSNIRLTSRQDFQLHNIELLDTVKLMKELNSIGLCSIGTGGNTARNVASSPMSGLYKEEEFDVTDYAKAAGNLLSSNEATLNLPRKYKVSFSSTLKDTGNASFADLGFFAFRENGEKRFRVVGAGGLGPKPKIAMVLAESIPVEDTLYYVDAMLQMFIKEGNWENKAKARIRHLLTELGEEEFTEKFNYYLKKSFEKDLSLEKYSGEQDKENRNKSFKNTEYRNGPETAEDIRNKIMSIKNSRSHLIYETNRDGIFAVRVTPIGGWLEEELHAELLEFIKNLDYEPELRLTPAQEILFRNLKEQDAEELRSIISRYVIDSDFSNSVSCIGGSICTTGICDSSDTLKEIAESIDSLSEELKKESFRIHISGCPSSCAQHQIAPISFSGRLIATENGKEQGFTLFLGGKLKDEVSEARLGTAKGNILRSNMPEFIIRLIELKCESGLELEEFAEKNEKEIIEILESFNS